MSDDREKLSQTEELENDENDVEAHVLGEDGAKNVLGEDGERGVLGEDGERSKLS